MRMPGWCEKCHKIRQVRINSAGLVRAQARNQVPSGICAECEQEEDVRRGRKEKR